jgi:hypothetical protein
MYVHPMSQPTSSPLLPRQRKKVNYSTFWMLIIMCAAAAISANSVCFAEPVPGEVFVEHGVRLNNTITDNGTSETLTMPGNLDLANAIKAEVAVEFANVHLGIKGQALIINETEWIPVPFPGTVPAINGDQDHIYMTTVMTVAVPLSSFKNGTNTFRFKLDPKGEQKMSYTQFYGATFRIYYDPLKKAHSAGKICTPSNGGKLGRSVDLTVETGGSVSKVQFIGQYEDFDHNGDGIYRGWIYSYRHGQFTNHIGTSITAPFHCTWDTSWIADSPAPMQIAARIVDPEGVIYMTEAVTNLTFFRGEYSVELCKPYGVLNGFSTCTYGTPMTIAYTAEVRNKTEYFDVRGPLANMADARLYFQCWKRASAPKMKLNSAALGEIPVMGGGSQIFNLPLSPATALTANTNTLVLINATDGGTDIQWPGVQVMIQYNAKPKSN